MNATHETSHGTRRCYDGGCRCDQCRAFNTARVARRRLLTSTGRRQPSRRRDVDPIAVELTVFGDRRALTCSEIRAAVARLVNNRTSAIEIARIVGVTERTVQRHLAALTA